MHSRQRGALKEPVQQFGKWIFSLVLRGVHVQRSVCRVRSWSQDSVRMASSSQRAEAQASMGARNYVLVGSQWGIVSLLLGSLVVYLK